MSDDLLQLIFAAALVLFGLLGGRKKKRPTQQPPRRRPEQPRPRPKQPAPRSTTPQPARPVPAARPAAPAPQRDVLVKELERLLGVPVEVEESGAIPEAVSLEQTDVEEKRVGQERIGPERASIRWTEGMERGTESLETLEEAGATSHELFHARYPTAAPAIVTVEAPPGGATLRLRQAIIWSEILGPPVGLRRS
jgi:hypothetical protein